MLISTIDSVKNFKESLKLPNSAEGLLVTITDCELFYESFYRRNLYVVDDLLDYRAYKIENSAITIEIFVDRCSSRNTMKDAFEETFFRAFSAMDIVLVQDALSEKRVTLEELFIESRTNPSKNIMKYVA